MGILRTATDIVGNNGLDGRSFRVNGFRAKQINEFAVNLFILPHLQFGLVVGIKHRDAALLQQAAYKTLATAYAASDTDN